MSAEGSFNHGTAGRINVERNKDGGVTLRLFQWSLKPDAGLTRAEAEKLVEKIQDALAPPRPPKSLPKAEAFDPEEFA
jgi:hypothetical protein